MENLIECACENFEQQTDRFQKETTKIRMEFKSKLKSLIVKHDHDQEFCKNASTPSGAIPKVYRRSVRGQEERSCSLSSESSEYFKIHGQQKLPAQNPKRLPHNDMSNLMACFTNLHLAHEIAINRCFQLKSLKDDDDSEFKTEMKKVFWDLQEEVTTKKSSYNQTLALIGEMKAAIHSLMMPHNHELREQVDKMLDLDRMRQEVIKHKFDFELYPNYIINVLAQICCPSRDLEIEQIRNIKEPCTLFKALFDLIENMKCDMDNFFINLFRPSIIKMSIENERKKFADYLELEYRLREDGLRATRAWLYRHRVGVRDTLSIIAKSFGEILHWTNDKMWPETLLEDIERFHKLKIQLNRIGIVGGAILELGKVVQKMFKNPPPGLRQLFSKYMQLLIPFDQTEDEEQLKKCLKTAAQRAVEATDTIITKYLKRSMGDNEKQQIHDAVTSVINPQNDFRCLILRCTIDYAEEVIIAAQAHEYHTTIPSTLAPVMYDVAILVSEFSRIVFHNQACFDELYRDICDERNKVPLFPPEENDGNWDSQFLETLKKLRSNLTTSDEAREIARRASEARMRVQNEETYDNDSQRQGQCEEASNSFHQSGAKSMTSREGRDVDDNGNVSTDEADDQRADRVNCEDDGLTLKNEINSFKEYCQDCRTISNKCHK